MVGVAAQDDATRAGLLLRLARQVTARHDLDDVLAEVFRCLRPVVEFGGGSIQLLDNEGWIQMAASDPVAPQHVMAQRIPLGTSVAGRVVLTEAPIYLPDIATGADDNGRRVSEGVRSYLGVPLVADGRAIGLLQVDSPEPDAWGEEEQAVFVNVAPIVAAAIQNARAHARSGLARLRADAAETRLAPARTLCDTARSLAASGALDELERCLARLDAVLGGLPPPTALLPRPRSTETAPEPLSH
jgi:GAF domain-containing protein